MLELAGVIPIYIASAPAAEPHIKSGKTRGLVTFSKTRLAQLDQIPTLGEALPGTEVDSWMAIFAPAGIPQAVEDKLSNALKTVLHDPEIVAQLQRMWVVPRWLPPAELKDTMEKEEMRWAAVVKEAGIKPE